MAGLNVAHCIEHTFFDLGYLLFQLSQEFFYLPPILIQLRTLRAAAADYG